MARPAIIGPKIHELVEKLVDEGKVESKTEAFKYIAANKADIGLEDMVGESAGTVAAAYYREHRKATGNAPAQRPQRSKPSTNGRVREAQNATDVDQLIDDAQSMIDRLAAALKAKEAENEALEHQLAEIKGVLGQAA